MARKIYCRSSPCSLDWSTVSLHEVLGSPRQLPHAFRDWDLFHVGSVYGSAVFQVEYVIKQFVLSFQKPPPILLNI